MSLGKSSFWFSLGTLFSRLLGLVREVVLAAVFGASHLLDAFFVAYRLPNMLRDMAAEGALGASFTTVFTKTWEKDPKEAKRLLLEALIFFSLVLSIICLLGVFFAPYLVRALTLFQNEQRGDIFFAQTVQLTRLLFPFILLMSVSAILAGALHQKDRFFISAVSPAMLNIGFIAGALLFAVWFEKYGPPWIEAYFGNKSIAGLSCGVLLGGLLQTLVLCYSVKKHFFVKDKMWTRISLWHGKIKKILILMGPMIIASSSGIINVTVNTNFATSLETGAVSWLNFSFRILQLPVGLFAVAISTAILPTLTRSLSRTSLSNHYRSAIDLTLWLLVPCTCFFMFNHYSIIEVLFHHGKFQASSVAATSQALFFYSFGLLGYGFHKVLTAFYYSLEKTTYAMNVSLFSIFLNFIINYFLVGVLGHRGLAFTTSIIMTFNAVCLFYGLYKEKILYDFVPLMKNILLLLTGIICSTFLQNISTTAINNMSTTHHLSAKLQYLSLLLANGTIITITFVLLATWYYNKTPKQWLK